MLPDKAANILRALGIGQQIDAPDSTERKEITKLAYLESYDDVSDDYYAFVAYKEQQKRTGEWRLKIKSKVGGDTSVRPNFFSMRSKMAKAAVAGKNYYTTGWGLTPTKSDPRLVENRIYFDQSLKPNRVEIHLVTRNSDGSAKDKAVARFDWPGEWQVPERFITMPEESFSTEREELGYISSYDVISDTDYTYVAFKETRKKSGEWKLIIRGKDTAGTSLRPDSDSLAKKIKEAAKAGKDYIVTGFSLTPTETDPRLVEHRVYFDESQQPSSVEIHVVTRNADGSAKNKKVAKFSWPA